MLVEENMRTNYMAKEKKQIGVENIPLPRAARRTMLSHPSSPARRRELGLDPKT